MKVIGLLCVLAFISCARQEIARDPSGQNIGLLELTEAMLAEVATDNMTHGTCARKANYYYQKLYKKDVNASKFLIYNESELNTILNNSFKVRLSIREKLKDFNIHKQNSVKCLKAVRDLTRALRYLEDYVVERVEENELESEYKTLVGEGSYFKVNSNYKFKDYNDLESGDIILSRGSAFSSAAIARIGETDAQFSHLTLVYKDNKGDLYTIESHIEIGAVSMPFSYHIDEKNTRTVVFRLKDKMLAAEAAYYMYHKVKNYSEKNKKNINYDFGMDYKDNKELFCSEVIFDGFNKASNGKVSVPLYRTKFDPRLVPFLQNVGIKVDKNSVYRFDTFGPGDIEFDTRFDLVAEWRDPLKLKQSRIRDAIVTKLFEWMETKGYKFKPSTITDIKSRAGWVLRRLGQYKEKFPLNMKVKQLKLFQVLEQVGEVLENKLIEESQGSKILSFNEMYEILEKYRLEDYKKYKNPLKKSEFHKWFN